MVVAPMRFLRLVGPLVAIGLLVLVPASNALTITVLPPTDPLPFDGPTTIEVQIDLACQEILNDNPTDTPMTRRLIAGSSVEWLETSSTEVPWTREQCDLNTTPEKFTCQPQPDCQQNYPTATTTGTITLTPKNIAPALTAAEISVKVQDKEGSAAFSATVAPYAAMNATTDRPTLKAGLGDQQPFNVTLDIRTNALSTASFTLVKPPANGTIRGLENVSIVPNIAKYIEHHAGFFTWDDGGPDAGKPVSVKVPLFYESAATVWGPDSATLEVRLSADQDPTLGTEPISLTWTFEPTVTETPKAESPTPDTIVFVVLLGLVALVRARRGPS